jgi:hypothetical protein
VFAEVPDLDDDEVAVPRPAGPPRPATPPAEGRARPVERDEEGGQRRRRGRGRGGRSGEGRSSEGRVEPRADQRGERRDVRPPPSRPLDDVDLDDDDNDELLARPPYPAQSPARLAAGAVHDDLDLDDEMEEDREGGHPVHKKIPTWQDAVGVLIDANMADRTTTPNRPQRGRGGRGRR